MIRPELYLDLRKAFEALLKEAVDLPSPFGLVLLVELPRVIEVMRTRAPRWNIQR